MQVRQRWYWWTHSQHSARFLLLHHYIFSILLWSPSCAERVVPRRVDLGREYVHVADCRWRKTYLRATASNKQGYLRRTAFQTWSFRAPRCITARLEKWYRSYTGADITVRRDWDGSDLCIWAEARGGSVRRCSSPGFLLAYDFPWILWL